MLKTFRNYTKIIVIIAIIALVGTGVAGYGALLSRPKTTVNANAAKYVAGVNNTKITHQEYNQIVQEQAQRIPQINSDQVVPFKLNVLNSVIDRELILQEAKNMGLKPDVKDENVEEFVDNILESNQMTEEELISYLQDQGSSLDELKKQIKEDMEKNDLINQTRENSYSNVSVSDEEVAKAYEKINPVVVVINNNDNKEEAEKAAQEAMAKIKEGTDIKEVVKEYSDLQYNDGDLGFIGHDNSYLPESITETAFELEKDQLSELIGTEKAFYIIKILDKKIAEGEEYEQAKADLKSQLLSDKQNKAFNNWLESVKAEADIEIYDFLLNGYKLLSEGKYDTAVEKLENAEQIYPIPMTYIYLARAYDSNDQEGKAVETFDNAVSNYPDDWQLHFNYGNYLAEKDDINKEKIIGLYDKASELAGEDFMAHYQLLMAYNQLEADDRVETEKSILEEMQKKYQEEQEKLQAENESAAEKTDEDSESINE